MSTSRGNHIRSRPQKHQNKTAFKNDLHDTSKKTKFINSLDISGVCRRCKDIIDWKIKYKKYKPLTAPSKCVSCGEKAVKYAYHVMCTKCGKEKNACTKCCKPVDNEESNEEQINQQSDIQSMLKTLPERKRRTILRLLEKQENGRDTKVDLNQIEELITTMQKANLNDDFDDFLSDPDEPDD